jgi:hypothetical protein
MFMHSHIQELIPMETVNLMQAVSYKLPQILTFIEAKLSNHLVWIIFPQYLKTVTLPLQEVHLLQAAILNRKSKTLMFEGRRLHYLFMSFEQKDLGLI